MKRFFFALFFLPAFLISSTISYTVDFEGVENGEALKAMKALSQLISLKKRPPPSINALRYRAESDVPEFLKVLKAYGYYEAKVDVRLVQQPSQIHVVVMVYPGPLYPIESYEIALSKPCSEISLERIGIELGKPALATTIINAELKALEIFGECGYPLASITNRAIIVDGKTKTLRASIAIEMGKRSYFGVTSIQGNTEVKNSFIEKKQAWQKGDLYDTQLVEKTQKNLMESGLFSAALILHDENPDENGQLPLRLEVTESKHKSINIGASYQTFYGPGVTLGWENRNIGGLGRKLHFQADATKRSHAGIATYLIPDFRKNGQNYLWIAQASHESITPYSDRSYSLANRLERLSDNKSISLGIKLERLYVTNSVQNGQFLLLEFPLYFRWSCANDLLNPTRGSTFEYRTAPTINFDPDTHCYWMNTFIESVYIPVIHDFFVIAQKFTFGSTPSANLSNVPVPKRFLGGSEEDLRGYRYLAVSPLKNHHKPIGGRSAFFYSFETRFRFSKTIGLVPFFDLGNVYLKPYPTAKGKWFKSTGLGLRYFSFFGPIRVDLAFPLDRRKEIDPIYRILLSIGQTF